MHTLMIKDLSASLELDRKAMGTVRGGDGNQANGIAQQNLQAMLAAVNVGNGLKVGNNSPVIIQSDNSFDQDAHNDSTAINKRSFALGLLRGLI